MGVRWASSYGLKLDRQYSGGAVPVECLHNPVGRFTWCKKMKPR